MNTTEPAFSSAPISLPLSSQRSPTAKPITSRYQPRLFSTSLTVKLGATPRRAKPFGCARFAAAFGRWAARLGVFAFARVELFFLVAISMPPDADSPRLSPRDILCGDAPLGARGVR